MIVYNCHWQEINSRLLKVQKSIYTIGSLLIYKCALCDTTSLSFCYSHPPHRHSCRHIRNIRQFRKFSLPFWRIFKATEQNFKKIGVTRQDRPFSHKPKRCVKSFLVREGASKFSFSTKVL